MRSETAIVLCFSAFLINYIKQLVRLALRTRKGDSSQDSLSYAVPANHRSKNFWPGNNLVAAHHRACRLSIVRSNAHEAGSYGRSKFRCAAYAISGTAT